MIDDIINEYTDFVRKIDTLVYESTVATEAQQPTDVTNKKVTPAEPNPDQNNRSNTQDVNNAEAKSTDEKNRKFGEVITQMMTALTESLRNFFDKFQFQFVTLLETDKGFMKEYLQAKDNYKPTKNIQVKMFRYNHNNLNTVRALFNDLIKKTSNEILGGTIGQKLGEDNIIEVSDKDFNKELIKRLHGPSGVESLNDYYKVLRDNFRGRITLAVVKPADIEIYEKIAISEVKRLRQKLNGDKNEAYSLTQKMVTNYNIIRHNKAMTDEVRDRAKKYASKLVKLESAYNSFLNFYYGCMVEEINQARAILKHMYQI